MCKGGLGAFPNLHGLGADGIKGAEVCIDIITILDLTHYISFLQVLLANGSLVEANAHTNSDLYHALKGGGSNFGMVLHISCSALRKNMTHLDH